MHTTDTICAIATAPGGAIGVIRVSGPEAIAATDRIFRSMSGVPLAQRKPRTAVFGHIIGAQGEIVDEVLVTHFHGPHSYTGEDSVEISCHGSSYILQQVMRLLTSGGCRLAAPGEYTQRAFLNGKMDLSQAEAVADLIASTSAATHRMAMNQMRGGFSNELSLLRDKLLHLTSLMELELDFSDHEELEFADRTELSQIAADIEHTVSRLAHSFSVGNALKNGVPVAIIGETNAGKSTLLNALVGEEKAIVSDIHGTTRDVIEDTVNLHGITFRFIDTAGIRHTTDVVESIGIERTYQKMSQADIILWMIDAEQDVLMNSSFFTLHSSLKCPLILLFNKADKITAEQREALLQAFAEVDAKKLFISAKERTGLDELENLLIETAALPEVSQTDVIVTNLRHYDALVRALDAIHRVQDGLQMQLSGDFVSQDLRECLGHLAEIVGDSFDADTVLGNIFKHFCIGK